VRLELPLGRPFCWKHLLVATALVPDIRVGPLHRILTYPRKRIQIAFYVETDFLIPSLLAESMVYSSSASMNTSSQMVEKDRVTMVVFLM
jgi:hypothetical protein